MWRGASGSSAPARLAVSGRCGERSCGSPVYIAGPRCRVFVSDLLADFRRDTNEVAWPCLAPDIAASAGLLAIISTECLPGTALAGYPEQPEP
jgi:hypothetical protein